MNLLMLNNNHKFVSLYYHTFQNNRNLLYYLYIYLHFHYLLFIIILVKHNKYNKNYKFSRAVFFP